MSSLPVHGHRILQFRLLALHCAILFMAVARLTCPAVEAAESAAEQAALARRYYLGDGVAQDHKRAFSLFKAAADRNDAEGQNGVGVCYAAGAGVKKDERESVRWFRLAAEQGLDKAQLNLAEAYWGGHGINRDRTTALTWALVAAVDDDAEAMKLHVRFSVDMPASEIYQARANAREWLAGKGIRKNLPPAHSERRGRPTAAGTGFFVTGHGHLLTCSHVVERSRNIWVLVGDEFRPAVVVRQDARNDLALLHVDGGGTVPLALGDSDAVALGKRVFSVGFPNIGVQGMRPKFTSGDISALTGIRDVAGEFQISVPVQPGNSGGPLADLDGNVIGIVNAKLSAQPFVTLGRPAPENVNYAIQISKALPLLRDVPDLRRASTRRSPAESTGTPSESAIEEVERGVALILVYSD